MNRIEIIGINRFDSYIEMNINFILDIPSKFSSIPNIVKILESYFNKYSEVSPNDSTHISVNNVLPFSLDSTRNEIQQLIINKFDDEQIFLNNFELKDYDTLIGSSYDGTNWS